MTNFSPTATKVLIALLAAFSLLTNAYFSPATGQTLRPATKKATGSRVSNHPAKTAKGNAPAPKAFYTTPLASTAAAQAVTYPATTNTKANAGTSGNAGGPPLGLMATNPLAYLMGRLTSDTATTHRTSGNAGVTATVFLSGHYTAALTVKRSFFYYSLGAGTFANQLSKDQTTTDGLVYVGGGIQYKKKTMLGMQLSATYLSVPSGYVKTPGGYELSNRKKWQPGIGVTASYVLRNHFWVSATLNTQLGTGLGATYFF